MENEDSKRKIVITVVLIAVAAVLAYVFFGGHSETTVIEPVPPGTEEPVNPPPVEEPVPPLPEPTPDQEAH
jgi:flagellar basal body-associated protein FliL